MATLKLKKKPPRPGTGRAADQPPRPPVRGAGAGAKRRPTLAQAQAERAQRESRYPPGAPKRRDERGAPRPGQRDERTGPRTSQRDERGGPRPVRRDETAPRDPRDADRRQRAAPPRGGPGGPGQNTEFEPRPGPRGPRPPGPPRDGRPPAQDRQRTNTAFEPRRPAPAQHTPARHRDHAPQGGPPGSPPHARDRRPPRDARRDMRPDDRRGLPPSPAMQHERAPHRPHPRHEPTVAHDAPGSLRLSKRISELGMASRREADEWIERGWVRVDGRVVNQLGARVLPTQHITLDPRARKQQARQVTILVNKPVGHVSGQAEDGYEPAVALVRPENHWREDRSGIRFAPEHVRGLAPAGRLDIDSVGLLVLTQDGRVARELIGEDSEVDKEYLVRVEPASPEGLRPDALALLNHGLELDGEPLRPAQVEWLNEDQLRFVLREGKKRQIRRMCEAVGLKVTGLKRVRIGRVALGDLPTGQWRYLRADEHFS